MGTETGISWADHTFNPWRGCVKVSAGCANCYAETLSKRNPSVLGEWGPGSRRVPAAESYWKQPLQWNRQAEKAGKRARVFCLSLGDVFEDHEALPPLRRRLGQLILDTPNLDWLLLTKRPERWREAARELWPQFDRAGFPKNVWIGASVEDQDSANKRIPILLDIPVKVNFLSAEPLIGPIEFDKADRKRMVDWVIVGGESGPRARPCDVNWICRIVEQCREAGAAVFVKQLGSNSGIHWTWKTDPPEELFERTPTNDPKGADPAEFRWFGEDFRQFPSVPRV